MKAGKLAICPWLICQYTENMLMDLPSSVISGKTYNLDLNAQIKIHILNVIYLEATKIE